MMRCALLATTLTSVTGWATCDFPTVDWLVVDSGVGKSATQKVTTLGTTTFIGGYAGGVTTLTSSASSTTVTNTETDWLSPCSYGCSQTGEMDMHISKIADDGTPQAIYIFEGKGLGSSPGWTMMHGMEDGLHLALALSISGNLTLPSGVMVQGDLQEQGRLGLVIKMKSDGSIAWHVTFPSTAGSTVYSVDGDAQGNMFVNYQTCVPCVSSCTPGTDGYGRPTGLNAPTCTRYLAKLNSNDGSVAWKKTIPNTIYPGQIRLKRTGGGGAAVNMYAWGSVTGAAVTQDSCTITSASGGTKSQAVLFYIDASNGDFTWCTAPTGDVQVSNGYMDLSPTTSSPVLVVQGGFSGTVAFGSTSLTATYGYYTSFVMRLSTTDGSVTWAEQTPMARGVQVTPDGAYVGVFCQTQGERIELTDAGGSTTSIRSRGSWDLIAMKLDAINGNGIYAMDGGGDSMEYFHGFGMNSQGDMLISGYSRSSSFHFGDQTLTNTQSAAAGGAGDNKIFTIQVSATSSTPSCISSCASNTPVITTDKCFIDNYCYADSTAAPYPARECFKCDASTSQTLDGPRPYRALLHHYQFAWHYRRWRVLG
jgi:hypothetical protein